MPDGFVHGLAQGTSGCYVDPLRQILSEKTSNILKCREFRHYMKSEQLFG